ncbi:MAG: CvpA family protein [Candidatus Sericytochromatia bacterium]|nr:CvpA family protein [Candidatus Tanganyikabacteria bacterium]
MNLVDALVLGTLGLQILRGLAGGFVRGSVGIAAWVLGGLLAWQDPGLVPGIARSSGVWPVGPGPADRVLTLVAVVVLLNAVALLLKWAIHKTPLAGVDRVLGAFLGALTGLVIVSVPLVAISQFPLISQIPAVRQTLAQSWAVPRLKPLIGKVTAAATGWVSPVSLPASGTPAPGPRPVSGRSRRGG